MNIAYFTDTYLPQINGVATSTANFAKELGKRGHRVLVITPRPKKGVRKSEAMQNVRVVHVPSMPAFVYPEFRMSPLVGLWRAYRETRAFDPDVIHFQTTLMISIDAIIIATLLRKPLVGTNHIYLTPRHTEYLSFVFKNPRLRAVATRIVLGYSLFFYNRCDQLVAPSQLLSEELKECGCKHPFRYVPNAVTIDAGGALSQAAKQNLKDRYGLREKVVLHVGRLSEEKAIDDVLKAFAIVTKKHGDVSLLIIGDGPKRSELEKLAADLGIADRMAITGFIEPKELMQGGLFRVADVFVTASPMESQGMVIVEAMSFGLPIVAVGEAAVREVVGTHGLLSRKNDIPALAAHIEEVLTSESRAKHLSALALERAHTYSIESVTDRLIALYEEVIAKKSLRGSAKSGAGGNC